MADYNGYINDSPWLTATANGSISIGGETATSVLSNCITSYPQNYDADISLIYSRIDNTDSVSCSLCNEIHRLKCEIEELKKVQNKRMSRMDTRINNILAFFQKLGINFNQQKNE